MTTGKKSLINSISLLLMFFTTANPAHTAEPAGKIILAKDGKSRYRIYSGAGDGIGIGTFSIPRESVLRSITLKPLHGEKLPGTGSMLRLNMNLPAKPVKIFNCSCHVQSGFANQRYRFTLILYKSDNKADRKFLTGQFRPAAPEWTEISEDFTEELNEIINQGYTYLSDVLLSVHRPEGNVPFYVDNVSVRITTEEESKAIYFNDMEKGIPAFGGELTTVVKDCAAKRGICQITDGVNPLVTGTLPPDKPLVITTGWQKPSSLISIGVSDGWYTGIGEIVYGTPGKTDITTYRFDDIKKDEPVKSVHGKIDFGDEQWQAAGGSLDAVFLHEKKSAGNIELYAYEELKKYLEMISGASFEPFTLETSFPPEQPLLIIGRNNILTAHLAPDIPYDKLGDDGFVIKTVGPHVIITGAQSRGTLYGVYWLLDRLLGVRWFSENYTFVPTAKTLSLPEPDELHVPRFEYRELFWHDGDDEIYRAHNLLNGKSHHRRSSKYQVLDVDVWSTKFKDASHNSTKIIPERLQSGGQVMMMDEQVRGIAALYFIDRWGKRKKSDLEYMGFSQADRFWIPDSESKKFAKSHNGALSAPLMDMLIDVANRVREKCPDAKLETLAYQWSFQPPEKMSVPESVMLTVAPIESDFSQPFNGEKNAAIAKSIEEWAQIAKHIVIWDYSAQNFCSYTQPHPTFDTMFESIQWTAQFPSIRGYFIQGAMGTKGAEFGALRQWVGARLLWNPKQDWKSLVDEFVKGYYGDAAPYIAEYIKLLHEAKQKTNSNICFRTTVRAPYLSFDVMRRADELFAKAEEAVAGKPDFLLHVKTARIGVDAVILLRRGEFLQEAKNKGINWFPDTERRLARIKESADEAGVTAYGEGTGEMSAMIETMKIERTAAPPLDVVKDVPVTEWVEFQDLDMQVMVGAHITPDPTASDGGAATLRGNTSAWGIQMRMDMLPQQGQWKLYVSVRVDPGEISENARAMTFGVWPGEEKRITVEEVADGEYHTFEVPGIHTADAGKKLWFGPPNSKAVKAIYVDRVVAVMVKPD